MHSTFPLCHTMLYLAASVAIYGTAVADERKDFLASIRPGVYDAEVLRVSADEQSEEIAKRFMAAVQNKSDWFKDYVKSNANVKGGLPYHENFGVTREEYLRFQQSKKTLEPHSKCKLTIQRDEQGCLTIAATDDAKILSGMRFDPMKLEVTWREFNSVDCIKTVPKATAIAYVDGVSWTKTVTESKDEMSSFYVSVARFVESEQGFLNVIINDVSKSKARLKIDLTLRWRQN